MIRDTTALILGALSTRRARGLLRAFCGGWSSLTSTGSRTTDCGGRGGFRVDGVV